MLKKLELPRPLVRKVLVASKARTEREALVWAMERALHAQAVEELLALRGKIPFKEEYYGLAKAQTATQRKKEKIHALTRSSKGSR